MSGVHLIAAVGLSGQIGLDGKVPWHGDPRYAENTKRDLAEFQRLTEGGVLIMGSVTANSLPPSMRRGGMGLTRDRVLMLWSRQNTRGWSPQSILDEAREHWPNRTIWICGGQMTYQAFIPYVDWHHISVIPYTGPADRWMPPIIPGWVSKGSLGYPIEGKTNG